MSDTIRVTPWNTQGSHDWGNGNVDRGGNQHDCLWRIAQEQVALKQNKDGDHSEVTAGEIQDEVDYLAEKNNIENPDVLATGQEIQVDVSPEEIYDAQDSVAATAEGEGGEGLTPDEQGALISSDAYRGLNDDQKNIVNEFAKTHTPEEVASYLSLIDTDGFQALEGTDTEPNGIDRKTGVLNYAAAHPDQHEALTALLDSDGFNEMYENAPEEADKLLRKYATDEAFRTGTDHLISQFEGKGLNAAEQAKALGLMRAYTGRGEGYNDVAEDKRGNVLVNLADRLLLDKGFLAGAPNPGEEGNELWDLDEFAASDSKTEAPDAGDDAFYTTRRGHLDALWRNEDLLNGDDNLTSMDDLEDIADQNPPDGVSDEEWEAFKNDHREEYDAVVAAARYFKEHPEALDVVDGRGDEDDKVSTEEWKQYFHE